MWFRVLLVFWICWSAAAAASGAADTSTPSAAVRQMLDRAAAAAVGIETTAIEGARSADTLGHERSGSGVLISADGLVLTIGYLIVEADAVLVTTSDGKTWPARVMGYVQATGFGLVRTVIPLHGLAPAPMGDVSQSRVGEPLLVATGGHDADIEIAYLADKRAFSGYWEYHIDHALFTAPAVANHSGAPLFNQRGELLGIGSLFVADAFGKSRSIPGNMFVPVDLLTPILQEMQATGTTRQSHRPWLGLTSTEQDGHVYVVRVTQDGPAHRGGLRHGDVILAVDGQPVQSLETFYKQIWARPNADDEMRVTLQREGGVRTLTLRGIDRMKTMATPKGI